MNSKKVKSKNLLPYGDNYTILEINKLINLFNLDVIPFNRLNGDMEYSGSIYLSLNVILETDVIPFNCLNGDMEYLFIF
jgi:hypothetical protein